MNIAILFSGRIIGFSESIEKYKEFILADNTVHIFIGHNSYNTEDLTVLNAYKNIHIVSKLYEMPDERPIIYSRWPVDPRGYYLSSMWYHRCLAYEMMKEYSINNNISFDVVISARTDSIITSKFNIDPPDENTLYIPNHSDYHGVNDQFAYGTMDSMEVYCNLYKNVKMETSGPEILLKDYLKSTNLNIKRIQLLYYLCNNRHIYNKERR